MCSLMNRNLTLNRRTYSIGRRYNYPVDTYFSIFRVINILKLVDKNWTAPYQTTKEMQNRNRKSNSTIFKWIVCLCIQLYPSWFVIGSTIVTFFKVGIFDCSYWQIRLWQLSGVTHVLSSIFNISAVSRTQFFLGTYLHTFIIIITFFFCFFSFFIIFVSFSFFFVSSYYNIYSTTIESFAFVFEKCVHDSAPKNKPWKIYMGSRIPIYVITPLPSEIMIIQNIPFAFLIRQRKNILPAFVLLSVHNTIYIAICISIYISIVPRVVKILHPATPLLFKSITITVIKK